MEKLTTREIKESHIIPGKFFFCYSYTNAIPKLNRHICTRMTNYPIKCSKKPPVFSGGRGGGEKKRGKEEDGKGEGVRGGAGGG